MVCRNSGYAPMDSTSKTGGALTHSHTDGTLAAAIGAVNGNSSAIGYQGTGAISGVSYTYAITGSLVEITSINHSTPVHGTTATESSLPPYIVVNVWRRTA